VDLRGRLPRKGKKTRVNVSKNAVVKGMSRGEIDLRGEKRGRGNIPKRGSAMKELRTILQKKGRAYRAGKGRETLAKEEGEGKRVHSLLYLWGEGGKGFPGFREEIRAGTHRKEKPRRRDRTATRKRRGRRGKLHGRGGTAGFLNPKKGIAACPEGKLRQKEEIRKARKCRGALRWSVRHGGGDFSDVGTMRKIRFQILSLREKGGRRLIHDQVQKRGVQSQD